MCTEVKNNEGCLLIAGTVKNFEHYEINEMIHLNGIHYYGQTERFNHSHHKSAGTEASYKPISNSAYFNYQIECWKIFKWAENL